MRVVLVVFICVLAMHVMTAQAYEFEYQKAWCELRHGELEAVLSDRTRVDCLTDEYAVEFDFCPKWAEAIGQALRYSKGTGKKPKIVLICGRDEMRYVYRVHETVSSVQPEIIVEVITR